MSRKMGTNNLFHQRNKRGARRSFRRQPKQPTHPKILIVCEGEKTEPNYFNGLRDELKISNARVEITGKSASNPMGVVSFARERYSEEERAGFPFDRVFCVFDKNNHRDYDKALKEIEKTRQPDDVFHATVSVPAFEYYLLLHYKYTTTPCSSAQVLSHLKKHIRGYKKGNKDIFRITYSRIEIAKDNARKSLIAARENDSENPLTKVHELVEFMQNMAFD